MYRLMVVLSVVLFFSCATFQERTEYIPGHRQNDDGLVIQSVTSHNESTWGGYFKHHIPPRPYVRVRVANDSPLKISALIQCQFSVADRHREIGDAYVELEPRETEVVNIFHSPRRWKIDARCRIKQYYREKSAHD